MWQDIIRKRTNELRAKLENISGNRDKVNFLKNYYFGKTAIIVGTGPDYKNQIDVIKNNINDNCILICIKQSARDFDMLCDFHIYNWDHYEKYDYIDTKPIVMFMNYSKPNDNNYRSVPNFSDINFFLFNLNNVVHESKIILESLESNENLFEYCDKNLGPGENMVPHGRHIIFEIAFPLAVSLGCSNIVTNGWVGGSSHGTKLLNPLSWDTEKYKHLYVYQQIEYDKSTHLSKYLYDNYKVHIFSLGNTNYKIDTITSAEFHNIINYRELIVVHLQNQNYDIGELVRYFIELHNDFNISKKYIKNRLKIINTYDIIKMYNIDHPLEQCDDDHSKLGKKLKYCQDKYFSTDSIFLCVHPYGLETVHNNIFPLKLNQIYIYWLNDPHWFAHFVTEYDKKVNVQSYSKKYNPIYMNIVDYLMTPSPIYFKNCDITEYNHKIKFYFYALNTNYYDLIDYDNYNKRTHQIILSGSIGGGYKTRIDFLNMKKTNANFDNLIFYQPSPGYNPVTNKNMTGINYYNKLSEFKGAFVGHHIFPLNFLLAKHIEILMCGCLGFFEKNHMLKEQLGLIEFVHYVPCSDDNGNLNNNFNFYDDWLTSEEGKIIALTGAKYVREKFGKNYLNEYINFFNSL